MRKGLLAILFLVTGFGAKAQCGTSVLEAFGATSALALYNTYITIGSIADGYVGETYEANYTMELMDEQLTMIGNIQDFIDKLLSDSKSGISADDKAYLREMKAALDDLYAEAEGLKAYAGGSDEASEKYNTARKSAWSKISELLGFEEE